MGSTSADAKRFELLRLLWELSAPENVAGIAPLPGAEGNAEPHVEPMELLSRAMGSKGPGEKAEDKLEEKKSDAEDEEHPPKTKSPVEVPSDEEPPPTRYKRLDETTVAACLQSTQRAINFVAKQQMQLDKCQKELAQIGQACHQMFDHASREAEISAWRDWSWTFEQYIASVDAKFSDDIQSVRAHLDRVVDPVDFSDAEKHSNTFFYSLLSSLLRQRALLVVRQVTGCNGLEAYRTLIQQNEPISKNRSMGLLNLIMNWPTFSNKMSLMQNVLKLEHAYAEYEKLGSRLNDDLKTAILMRSVTGQLKVWLQLQVTEATTYNRVREMILLYDTSTTRWSEQMVLGSEVATTADGPMPMEIDRVEGKSKGRGSKGKSGAKGFNNNPKGKSKGKQKGQNKGAAGGSKGGKGKSEPKGAWSKGDSGNKGQGQRKIQRSTENMLELWAQRSILLKERVAISSGITQPILCFGHLLEQGFGIGGVEQSLVHRGGAEEPKVIRAVQAEVQQELINSPIGWSVNNAGYIIGRHLSDHFQDPSLAFPALQGPQCRTTLVKLDDGSWCILALNEPLRSIIQLDSKFHDMDGMRSVITIVTEGEKPPGLMGFAFEEDGPTAGQIEPQVDPGDADLRAPDDDIQGVDIEGPSEVDVEGQAVGEAQIVVQPAKDDEIVVDGITLKSGSSLAALRAACSSYGISSSGGKVKCFSRLVNHQKNLELQTITHAAQDALNAQVRVPNAPASPEPPSEAAQDLHRLTHTPYQPWCESCVAHRARADRHAHDFSSKDGSCPTISFDYFYTKAGEQSQDPDALVALVLVDSKTGYLGCVPMNSKAQFDLATKEIIAFCQTLGYNKVMLRCDNEPSVVQLQRLTAQARQRMGLETQACTPSAYEHGNALAENAIQRIRGLAGSLMHNLQSKLAVTISSNHALWS
eukprot:s2263_g10.t1